MYFVTHAFQSQSTDITGDLSDTFGKFVRWQDRIGHDSSKPFLVVLGRGSERDVVYHGWPKARSYMSPNAGWGCFGVSANEYTCAHGAQKRFEDLTPYLTYERGLRQINTCRKVSLKGNFFRWRHLALVSIQLISICSHPFQSQLTLISQGTFTIILKTTSHRIGLFAPLWTWTKFLFLDTSSASVKVS